MAATKFKVWECKIVVPFEAELPPYFDGPPRCAAEQAVTDAGIEVVAVLSGWGGSLTEIELDVIAPDHSADEEK